jgi:hypothetical protein
MPESRIACDGARTVGNRLSSSAPLVALAAILALSLYFHLWGIRRNLPILPEMDEVLLYEPAVRIASTGNPNPGWFGYPGSTVIYPTALGVHVWQAVAHDGTWLRVGPAWPSIRQTSGWSLVLVGRLVSVAYSVAALLLLFVIGRRLAGSGTALAGAALAALCPTTIDFAQQLRTDGPATFFGLLHLAMCLRLLDRPGWATQALAGATLGLAIATRYLLATVAPVLLTVEMILWWRARRAACPMRIFSLQVLAGLACVPAAFVVATPYAILDHRTAWSTFREVAEKQQTHLGADGLGPAGNFWWYVSTALPGAFAWSQIGLAGVGVARICRGRESGSLLMLLYTASFLAGISQIGLHWARWLLPILPLVALFAAHGLLGLLELAPSLLGRAVPAADGGLRRAIPVLAAVIVVVFSIAPARTIVAAARLRSVPTTDVIAAEWIAANLPAASVIVRERYTAPLAEGRFMLLTYAQLPEKSLDYYLALPVDFALASSHNWNRFAQEATRYPKEVAFYRELHRRGLLVKEFAPSATRAGPTVRVYALSDRARAAAAQLTGR